ncbi:carbohydrate binding -containing domain protein, partial [Acinetobacter baumannii 26016_6]
AAIDANASAIQTTQTKVDNIDGRVTSTANAVTSLQGSVSSIEKGLSTKADASALNNYYTKTEADSAASGAIDKFNSQLTIGGVNVVANSEAPRTSTAATNREYLLYERSAELKAFYDENLEKPITISFEMSVPVAGPVQVYSSNGSAHQFVTSVNAIIVNQFAKYSVTVSPKAHTASTTVSTIEFYGTYGTGRIPTIRKLQIEAGTKATAWSPSPRDTKAAIDANASAIQTTQTKVDNIDGRVTSTANAVTSLQGSVSSIEKGLSTKADASALNNYYTKTEADSAASGAIDKFNSQLTIGGVNVVANSEAPRTSTAATNREYLLYERSAELKAFYDENLEKPITISFEMSVPVAGPVQVYSSNGSAHQFVTSVNAIIVNQFAKYSVTVSPKAHTASTTVSTIEFYGTYGTGRIPTIRKLQIEAGTKATAWSPSPRDTKAAIDANASAIQTTQTKVDNIDGRLTTATDSITSLNSRMSTAEGNINSTNTAVGGLSTRMATAEGKITNQSDSIASLQNSVTSINGTLANKADSSAVNNLTSRVETAEGKISSQSGQITSLSNSLDLTNSNLNDVNVLARLLSLGKPLREDPTFKTTSSGGLSAYNFPAGTSWIKQAKSTDNPTGSTHEMLIKATQALGGGWYPTAPTLVLTANKTFLIKQIIKMPVGTKLQAIGNATGTGGYIRILGNDLGTGKFETYYSVVQGGADLSGSTIQGHFRVIAGTNPPVPTVDNPVFVILASYEVFDVTAVNDTIPKAYSDAIAANANAINTLSNTVSQQGNTITSHSNSITTLTNKITNNDLSNLVLNPDFVDPKSDWTSGVIVDATDAAPNPPSPKALRLNNRDSYYGPFVKCNVGDMFYVSAWFATPNTSVIASAVLGFNTRNSAGTYTWYSVAVKSTDKNAWGMVEGYFTVPNGMVEIRPWLQVSIAASEAAGQQWHVTNIQVRNITGNKKLATDLQATSSALSTLDSKVTNIDGRVTSASNNIVSLNNSVTNINATLAQKADSSALTNLANRVTTTEGAITSQGSSITSLNASVNGLLKDVAVSDTRSTNQPPSWYWSNYPLRIVREFKQASVLGLTGMGTYVSLETYVYWTDASGGPIIQIARGTDSKLTAERRSTSTSTWGSWTQDIKTLSDGLANKAEASAVNTLDAKVSTIDGKVSTQASNIVSLQTAVGGNTSAISEQSKSIDGIRNIKTITIDNNGVMSGYGLISDLVNGKVTSTFGVNADNFYIGPPSGGKKPFLVTTTNTTVNGVTYPPGTWIDTAYIATASIKSAHIQDAAITTAKIADAAIDTAKIKDAAITNAKIADLTVDTIKIKDNAITVATVAENTQASKILTPSSSTFDACQVTVVTSGTNFVKIDVSPFLYAWNKYSSPQIYLDIYRDDTLIKTFNLPWIQSTEVFKDRSWTEGGSYDVLYNIVVYTMNTMAGSMFTTLDRPAAGTHVYKATLRRTTNWGRDNAMDMARRYNEIEFTNALILITEVKK